MRSGTFGARGNIILMNWIYGSTSVGSLLSELRCLTWNSDLKIGLLLKAGFSAECRCLPAKLQPKRFHSIATFSWKHLNSLSTFLFNWKLSHALSCSSKPTQDTSGGIQFWSDAKPGWSKPRYKRLYPWLSFLESLFRVKGFKTAFWKWALQPAFLGERMHCFDCQSIRTARSSRGRKKRCRHSTALKPSSKNILLVKRPRTQVSALSCHRSSYERYLFHILR